MSETFTQPPDFLGISVVFIWDWSEQPLEKPRAVGLMNVPPPCSAAVVGTVPAVCCSPSPLTHMCIFPPAWDPCCRAEEGTAAPSSCRMWSLQGDATCTGHDGTSPGTGENTWSWSEVWRWPHPRLRVRQWDIQTLRKKTHKKVCLPLKLIFILFHLFNLCLTRPDSYFRYSMATLLPMCLNPLSQEDQGDHASRGCAPNSEPAENVLNVSWSQGFPSSFRNITNITIVRWVK